MAACAAQFSRHNLHAAGVEFPSKLIVSGSDVIYREDRTKEHHHRLSFYSILVQLSEEHAKRQNCNRNLPTTFDCQQRRPPEHGLTCLCILSGGTPPRHTTKGKDAQHQYQNTLPRYVMLSTLYWTKSSSLYIVNLCILMRVFLCVRVCACICRCVRVLVCVEKEGGGGVRGG